MKRRDFIQATALGSIGLTIPLPVLLSGCGTSGVNKTTDAFKKMTFSLLKEWCDGMIAVQINDPDNPEQHGALGCPACNKIHGRCMDAVYPFLYMADATGEQKYLDAGIKVFEWSENVSMPDGSWTVIPDPKSWKGITVFGAIALAEALYYHGHLLDKERRKSWTDRLSRAGDYLYNNFDMTFTNINYGFTAVYALNLLGRVLDNSDYINRSHELALEVKNFFTKPNYLLFGEGKPSTKKSPKGHYPVDLGYNVEESLNGVVMYALHENDEEMLQLLTKSLESHLEFMLPDGAWDNSWGTRQAKWSYWGSRTTDGCQIGYGLMAGRNSAFGTAAFTNTELLKRCTNDGLLHGGPHYVSHGVKPCVHHTFAHAKPLATLLDMGDNLPNITNETPLPRSIQKGIKAFPEIDTWVFGRDDWRGTVTSYDFLYREDAQQATGGAPGVLYHMKAGLIFAASMAKYVLVERNNMQANPGEDFALTPRIEAFKDGNWFTNLYDLNAKVHGEETNQSLTFEIETTLMDENRKTPKDFASEFRMFYTLKDGNFEFRAKPKDNKVLAQGTALVLPVISQTGEKVMLVSPTHMEIERQNAKIVLKSNFPMVVKPRIFNMVPGAEAIPVTINFPENSSDELWCTIEVHS